MTNEDPRPVPPELIHTLRAAQSITVLTGAGISAESGIPTFRESQTGLWAKYNPQELATPQAFTSNPQLVIAWYRWRLNLVNNAQPNTGHEALARMETKIPRFTLITQNVDSLHKRAGSQNIIELHGSLRRLRCSRSSCGYQTEQWPADEVPQCPRCGSRLRPDVVWFGESLPETGLQQALQASRDCEVFLSIGTSGIVEPAASLPYEALRAGAVVVEINTQPTPLSVHARYEFPQPAGVILPQIVEAGWPTSP